MFRILTFIIIVCLAISGTALAEENWQLKYEQLAKQHVQLLDESIKLKSMVMQLSAAVTRQEMIDRKNSSAVLSAELKRIEGAKKSASKPNKNPKSNH